MPRRQPLYVFAGLISIALAAHLIPNAASNVVAAPAVDELAPVATGLALDQSRPVYAANMTAPVPARAPATTVASLIQMAKADPMALAELGRERYTRDIRDYSCIFHKQERIDGKLGELQQIKVLFRDAPHSVYMTWIKNEDECRRALYVKGRHVTSKGEQQAMVEPAGALIRILVKETLVDIHSDRSRKASRRTIDEFGFKSTLDLLSNYNKIAIQSGVLDIAYSGEGKIDNRPTFVLIRNLPYTGPKGQFPDARMIIHLDQEWLLPVAVYSYADKQEKVLLGSYVMTDVKLNQNLGEAHFKF